MVWWVVRLCQKSFSRNTQLQMFKLPNSWLQIILIQPGKSIWAARARETKKNTSVQQLWPAYNQISKRETQWKYNLVGKYKQKTVCYHFKCFCPNVYTRYHRHLDFCLDHLYFPIRQQINKAQCSISVCFGFENRLNSIEAQVWHSIFLNMKNLGKLLRTWWRHLKSSTNALKVLHDLEQKGNVVINPIQIYKQSWLRLFWLVWCCKEYTL